MKENQWLSLFNYKTYFFQLILLSTIFHEIWLIYLIFPEVSQMVLSINLKVIHLHP